MATEESEPTCDVRKPRAGLLRNPVHNAGLHHGERAPHNSCPGGTEQWGGRTSTERKKVLGV